MAEAILTQYRIKEILSFDANTGVFTWKSPTNRRIRPGSVAGCVVKDGRVRIKLDGKMYLAHRLAWLYVYGEFPSIDLEIDHINGNPNDNRISNLRAVTHAENMHNLYRPMASNKTSGVLGVSYNGSKKYWVAQIRANGRTRVVGRFKSVSEASAAYKAAKALLHPKAGYSKMENG